MSKKRLIMAVDDEPHILKLVRRILEQAGYDVITAGNGDEMLALLGENTPDLIILDISMPGLNGIQLLDSIREKSNIPVIMLTARDEPDVVNSAFSFGANDYVRKPFHKKELLARIAAKLRRARTD